MTLEPTEDTPLDNVRLTCYVAIAVRHADGGWTVRVPAFPNLSAQGESQGQARVNALRAVTARVDEFVALDLIVPHPSTGPLSNTTLCIPSALALRIFRHNERMRLAQESRSSRSR